MITYMRNLDLPDWVRQHKATGTEVRVRDGRFYLYKITSKWDRRKRRSQKITQKYLGRITPEGVVAAKHERIAEGLKHITVKEYGVGWFLQDVGGDIITPLKEAYPGEWQSMLVFAIMRLAYAAPMKLVREYYLNSFLSESLPAAATSSRSLSRLVYDLGMHRGRMLDFLKHFTDTTDCAVIDGTHIFSQAEGVAAATLGYNSKREFNPQVRMILIHALDHHRPAYFRILPGSVPDVTAITLTIEEASLENAILIGDKGFYSADNVKELNTHHIAYILPLKRNSTLIDYSRLDANANAYFLFNKRAIAYSEYLHEDTRVITYLDETLRAQEKNDFLQRIENDKASLQEFTQKQHTMGTITILTTHTTPPPDIYQLLKSRNEIESVIDTFKNTLHADRTYMRTDHHLHGWMLINFIALLLHYRIYNLLRQKKLLNNHSPKDLLTHLTRIHKLKIGPQWTLSEVPKKTQTILDKLQPNQPITQNTQS